MDQTFNEIRRKDRALDDEKTICLLENAEYGILSLGAGHNGYTYGVPMSFVFDKAANAIYLHSALTGHKLENLAMHSKVSFCVVGCTEVIPGQFTTNYESAIVFAIAEILQSEEERRDALLKLVLKYSPDFIEKGEKYIEKDWHRTQVIKLAIQKASGKSRIGHPK